jgi:hypothetical protein
MSPSRRGHGSGFKSEFGKNDNSVSFSGFFNSGISEEGIIINNFRDFGIF